MDADTALRVLASMIGAGATIAGFLVVAAIFLLGQLLEHSKSYNWIKDEKDGLRLYLSLWGMNLALMIGAFLVPLIFALGVVFDGVSIMAEIPGGGQALDDNTTTQIQTLVSSFKIFVMMALVSVTSGLILAYALPQVSDYYSSTGIAIDTLVAHRYDLLLSEALLFLIERPAMAPQDGDILRWAKNEYSKGPANEFRRFVEESLPRKLKNATENRKRVLDWTSTVILLVLLGIMALQIAIWSVFF